MQPVNPFKLVGQGVGTLAMSISVLGFMHSGANFFWKFAFVHQFGFGAIYIGLAVNLILIAMSFVVPKAVRMAQQHDYLTFTDLARERQGPLMGHWINFASLYSAAIFITANLFVAGNIISLLSGFSAAACTFFIASVIYAYIWFGGYRNIIRTDILQIGVMLVLALAAVFFIDHDKAVIIKDLTSPNWNSILLYAVLALSIPASPDLWQRFFAAREPASAGHAIRWAVAVDVLFSFALTAFILLVLESATGLSETNPLLDFFVVSSAPRLLIIGFAIYIICAMLSTVDNLVFNATSVVAKNILGIDDARGSARFVSAMRLGSLIMLASLSYVSLRIGDLVQWLISYYPVLGVLTFYMFYAVLKQGHYPYRDSLLALSVIICALIYLWVQAAFQSLLLGKLCYFVALVFIFSDLYLCQRSDANLRAGSGRHLGERL